MVTSFADKTVLVTGANNGIGAAIVRAFAQRKACIGLHFLESIPPAIDGVQIGHTFAGRTGAESVAGEARKLGASVALTPADLADPDTIAGLFDSVEGALGPVDILVNNAAHFENPDTVFDVSAGTFDRYFTANSRAPALLMREFGRRHRARGGHFGRIINISTDAARAFGTQIGYGASKLWRTSWVRSALRSTPSRPVQSRPGTSLPKWSGSCCPRFPCVALERLRTSLTSSFCLLLRRPVG